ncbi:NAD(P)-dependent oxidoreductase [Paracoccus onubensis]|uniref:NAD-dependent epimerase/dehydratase family protein n=1 Tax=Paracoccus onubensis TaxID=1675788 RepID=UPI00273034E6|nr:NAD(P)-dependent oxidoreductase [Paracoccus onubensis]MDP0927878.1 NAD(P)-dependent oxidoreductase [Paracoccus onubensis]
MAKPFNRILITGAAGDLGGKLREGLAPLANHLRLADRMPIPDLQAHEEGLTFDLSDEAATIGATRDVDAIVHFGGASRERVWNDVLDSTIRGSYHIYEGARKHGVKRVIYASSIHAVGYHASDSHIDTQAPVRPDSLYGVSKCFVEALSSLYWNKFGIETACLRIVSCFPEPADRRMLGSWLSYDDCIRLVASCLTANYVGHSTIFGVSDNRAKLVDNSKAAHLGFVPQDSSEPYRAQVEATTEPLDPMAATTRHLGGWFVDLGHPDDETAR